MDTVIDGYAYVQHGHRRSDSLTWKDKEVENKFTAIFLFVIQHIISDLSLVVWEDVGFFTVPAFSDSEAIIVHHPL